MSDTDTSTQPSDRSRPSPVTVGDAAPDFTLANQTGAKVALHDFLGKGPLVVYFYPKDETGGCTAEACSFRDNYEVFKQAGAEVIGISSDSADSHQSFAQHHRLPFVLLSDAGNHVRKLYGVPSTMGILPGRVTYILDAQGIVRHIFSSQLAPTKHVNEALRVIAELQPQGTPQA